MANKYTYTIWRRKTASAQVKLFEGKGEDMVNGKKITDYITRSDLFDTIYTPLKLAKLKEKMIRLKMYHLKIDLYNLEHNMLVVQFLKRI